MSASGRHSLRSRPSSTLRRLTLSQAMNQFPRYCEEKKIALVEKSIAAIDEVPRRFAGVETLLLSNNLIPDLGQISQFKGLKSLSLANNRIEKLTQLQGLRGLKDLEMVYFDGCPVCLLPTYRDFLVDMLPSLRSLDSKEVSEQERTQAKLNLKQLNRIMDLLVINEEEGTKLEHLQRQLALHQEMLHKGLIRTYSPISVANYLAWIPLDWPEPLQMQVLDTFEGKAKMLLRRNAAKDCLWAYTQSLMDQQQIVARLMILCEQAVKDTANVYIKRETLLETTRKSPNSAARNRRSPSIDLRLSRSISIQSNPEITVLTPKEKNSPAVLTTNPVIPQKSEILLENEVLRKKLHEKEQIARQNVTKSDEKSHELEEKIAFLSSKVAFYEKEKLKFDNKLSIALARNSVLEARISVLFAQAETGCPVQPSPVLPSISLISQQVRNRMLKIAVVKTWKAHNFTLSQVKKLQERSRRKLEREVTGEVWRNWSLAFLASTHKDLFATRREKLYISTWFQTVKSAKRRQNRLNRILDKVNKRRIMTGFEGFKEFPIYCSKQRAKNATAQATYSLNLFFRAFKGWFGFVSSWTIPTNRLKVLENKADLHRKGTLVKKTWNIWREWQARFGHKRHQSLLKAKTHYQTHLKRLIMKLIRSTHSKSQDFFLTAINYYEKMAFECAFLWLKALKSAVKMRKVKIHTQNLAQNHRKSRIFGTFRRGAKLENLHKKSISVAKAAYKISLIQKSFRVIKKLTRVKKSLSRNFQLFQTRLRLRKSRVYLLKWTLAIFQPDNKQEKMRKEEMRLILREWLRVSMRIKGKKYKSSIGCKLFIRKTEFKTLEIVTKWHIFASNRRKERLKTAKMAKIIENRAILQFYTAWKGVFSQSLLARAELKLQESLKEQRLSAISRSQSADIEAANRELKTVNEEREKEMMSLKGKLEEMMRNEEFLKREVREMQGKWKECREELANTQRNSEEERKKLDKMVKNYEIQLQTAKSQVDSLHQDLLQKSDTLQKTYENARHLEKDLETRLQQLEEENTVLKRELKSRETGLQHTELLSLSLKAGLDKAARLLTPAVSQTARVHIRSQSGLEEKPGVMKTTEQLVLSKYRAYRDTDKPRSRRYVTQTEDETSP